MPTTGDNILGDDSAVLVASLMPWFLLNFGKIIIDEIKIQATRTDTTYPFPCLITKLYEEAHVSMIAGQDSMAKAIKIHNFDQRDESRPTLSLGK